MHSQKPDGKIVFSTDIKIMEPVEGGWGQGAVGEGGGEVLGHFAVGWVWCLVVENSGLIVGGHEGGLLCRVEWATVRRQRQ